MAAISSFSQENALRALWEWLTTGGTTAPTSTSPGAAISSTGTITSVADTASSTTLLAANTARKSATVFNDSAAILYLKLGATASTTSYTAQVPAGGYYELPIQYTGIIDGIWASDASGSARITELT